jgi:hypothetical protein
MAAWTSVQAVIRFEMIPYPDAHPGVIAGLDPAIHPLRKILAKLDGCAGQARA